MTWHGQGASVLMLPAPSSISTRSEMWPLQQRLGSWFTTLAIDWVGFGDRPRPPLRWSPEIYRRFLAYLLDKVVPRPFATIAAGHAAAYCLDAAAARPGSTGRLCLIAPTWRGPLPTMMGRKHPMFVQICRTVDWPVVGDLLYRLNVNRFMVRKMALGHVYAEPSSLSEARFEEKLAVTRASGARHSSIRFGLRSVLTLIRPKMPGISTIFLQVRAVVRVRRSQRVFALRLLEAIPAGRSARRRPRMVLLGSSRHMDA